MSWIEACTAPRADRESPLKPAGEERDPLSLRDLRDSITTIVVTRGAPRDGGMGAGRGSQPDKTAQGAPSQLAIIGRHREIAHMIITSGVQNSHIPMPCEREHTWDSIFCMRPLKMLAGHCSILH